MVGTSRCLRGVGVCPSNGETRENVKSIVKQKCWREVDESSLLDLRRSTRVLRSQSLSRVPKPCTPTNVLPDHGRETTGIYRETSRPPRRKYHLLYEGSEQVTPPSEVL